MPDCMFQYAHPFVAKWEGGLSDNPNDHGGITAYGASLAFVKGLAATKDGAALLDSLGIARPVSAQTIRKLTPEQVKEMFWHEFWVKPKINQTPDPCAFALYDCAVNMGAAAAIKLIQQAANQHGASLGVDGVIGPKTIAALKTAPLAITLRQLSLRRQKYQRLAAAPGQSVFLKGWLNRLDDLARNINKLFGK